MEVNKPEAQQEAGSSHKMEIQCEMSTLSKASTPNLLLEQNLCATWCCQVHHELNFKLP